MPTLPLPFSAAQLHELAAVHPTPFYLYDEAGMRRAVRDLQAAFAWAPAFREYFAVKAAPNPQLLTLLAAEGCGLDCSSLAELTLAERIGLRDEQIMFTSNNTPAEEFVAARRLGALINLDALEHLAFLEQHAGLPGTIGFRLNPGPLRAGDAIMGKPEESKFGVTRDQLRTGYTLARDRGVQRFGIHAMVASNERDPAAIVATAHFLFELVVELSADLGITFDYVDLGGGIGIPYRPEEAPVDLAAIGRGIHEAFAATIGAAGLPAPLIAAECGRLISGPHGYLISRVRHIKATYRTYAGVDASMADLMRPGMYGAYHHISVVGKEDQPATHQYDVVGALCENNDKFAIQRPLPELAVGDLLVIHDAGAHGRAMGFNYNGRLRCGEVLLQPDGGARLIRRAETLDDYFATLVW
jgi:diaminopimelate decarboxylase